VSLGYRTGRSVANHLQAEARRWGGTVSGLDWEFQDRKGAGETPKRGVPLAKGDPRADPHRRTSEFRVQAPIQYGLTIAIRFHERRALPSVKGPDAREGGRAW